jgi:AraC-like DNA-binding protein
MKYKINPILLNAGYAVHYADWNWKGVHSPFARLYLVDSGSAQVEMNGNVYPMSPGHLYLIPAFTTHGYVCTEDFTIYYFCIYDEHNIYDHFNFPWEVDAGEPEVWLIKRLFEINPGRALRASDPTMYDNPPTFLRSITANDLFPYHSIVETKGIIMQLLSRFLSRATLKNEVTDSRIAKAIRYIRNNIEKKITVKELAEVCCVTKDNLFRLFKKELKSSPVQYINRKKIEKAQLMMILEQKPIQEIAYSLSFDNISYFNRIFKASTGMVPQQYRKNSV